jgi:hypothetical protein
MCSRRWQQASIARESDRASLVGSGRWRIGIARLPLRADGLDKAPHTRFGECTRKFVAWLGRFRFRFGGVNVGFLKGFTDSLVDRSARRWEGFAVEAR